MKHAPVIGQTTYDRSAVAIGVVHLGYGAFHRAHQAVYLDDYMQATGDLRWGIAAVNLRASERDSFRDAQAAVDGYVLKTMAPDGSRDFRLVRSHVAFADWTEDAAAAEALLARDSVQAVTMTVTESGYSLRDDWTLDTAAPPIRDEIDGGPATTVYGFLANALDRRMQAGLGGVTVLCCDNMRGNGDVLGAAFRDYLRARGLDALREWVEANVGFPCSMVDRITPRAPAGLMREVAPLMPGRATAPVHAEAFAQWVIEDGFAAPFPDLTRVGVQVVDDVAPFEEAKIRILNGGHTGLCYLGALAGHLTFDAAMRDPALRLHLENWETREVLPGLTIELPFDKTAYWGQIAERFSNAAIADQLERICMDGWSKMPIYVRPTLESCLRQGIRPRFGFDCVASWYVFARRARQGRTVIPYHEPFAAVLNPLLARGQEAAFASARALWGDLPEQHAEFVPGIVSAIKGMEEKWPA